jgi:formylglycine-generating enzyme required for sulfatase activity
MRTIRQMLLWVLIGVVVLGVAITRADDITVTGAVYYDGNDTLTGTLTPTATQGVYSVHWVYRLFNGTGTPTDSFDGSMTANDLLNGPINGQGRASDGYWYSVVGAATNGVWTFSCWQIANNSYRCNGMLTVHGVPIAPSTMTLDLGGGVNMDFVLIPAGTYVMGTTNYSNAQPVHLVTLTNPYYLGKYEVTEQQYAQITGTGANNSSNPINNATGVNFWNYLDFCTKLSAKCGVTARLPTEAEWEYAARAGSSTLYFFGDSEYAGSSNMLAQYAWFTDGSSPLNPGGNIHPVGQLLPNPLGLYDIYGNVWEACADYCSGGSGYGPEVANPNGSVTNPVQLWDSSIGGDGHTEIRGGAFHSPGWMCNSFFRYGGQTANGEGGAIGLRVLVEVTVPKVSVSITSPMGGSIFIAGGDVTINATASTTNGTIAKVDFYQGTTQIGEDTSSPFTYIWTGVALGNYSLTAKAIDSDSVTGISTAVSISVQPPPSGAPTIFNSGGASSISTVSATLNGNLVSTGSATTVVSVYWGATDNGTNTVGWDHVADFGQCAPGTLSINATGLSQGTLYYYRFYASNAFGPGWANPAVQFTTASAPSVDNGSGATSITPMSAQLSGDLTAGGDSSVTVYWGSTDGGTTPSNWQHANSLGTLNQGSYSSSINGLTPITTYYFRSYATNAYGAAWAGSTASLQTAPTLANGWAYGVKIRFAGYNKAETLTNFPALVVFGTNITNFAYGQCQSPNGWDLRFADSNQVTALNYEIDQWNTNGNSYVWVQVPKLASSNDCIWAYWGNTGAAAAPAAYTTNGSTWDANYKGVWHLGEKLTQNQSTGTNTDSTSYGNNGLQHNNGWTNGIVGGAQNFDGSSCYINTAASMTNGAMTNLMTLSLWVKVLGPADWGGTMFMLYQNGGSILEYYFSNQWKQKQSLNLSAGDRTGNGSMSTGVWYYLTETFAKAGGNNSISYLNGAYDGTYARADQPSASGPWFFGKSPNGSPCYFEGAMEEIRVEQVQRSSNWVWACYQTMAANALFTSYEVQSGGTPNTATIHGIPYTWLASYGIANTNDSVETEHMNGSLFSVLQNYIAGLNPTDPNSCFLVGITNAVGQIVVRVPSVQATGGKTRYYDIEMRTNLLDGASWQPVPSYTNIPGNGSIVTCTNATQDHARFYRVKVHLQ